MTFVRFTVVVMFAAMLLCGVNVAVAETRTVPDPHQDQSQRPALDLERTTFQFAERKVVYRLKIDSLSVQRTQAFARLYLRNYDLLLKTKFDGAGNQKVVGFWSDHNDEDLHNRFTDGLTAAWDFESDTITFTLTKHIRGQRARLAAYTVRKGDLHGPPFGDYMEVRVARG